MKLNCKINQAEALRRGFDTNADACLDIDPTTMSQEDRDILAVREESPDSVHLLAAHCRC